MNNKKPYLGISSISDLPSPILTDILSLLPIKSVLSCKLVSKLWCSFIRDPHFRMSSNSLTMILRRVDNNKANKNLHLVEPELDYAVKKRDQSTLVLGRKAMFKLNDGGFDGIPVRKCQVVNSCNGLVCLVSNISPTFIVCNPIMSDYVVVKPLENLRGMPKIHAGFGFSSKSKQYKVVVFYLNSSNQNEFEFLADVFSLGSDEEWRPLTNPLPKNVYWSEKSIFLEGALHWIIRQRDALLTGSIIALDCEEEKFVLMDFPVVSTRKYIPPELGILHSQLCFCYKHGHNYDIWAMNEYRVKESWRKLFVISTWINDPVVLFKPLAYWNHGEILMLSSNKKLSSYNVESDTLRNIKITGVITKVEALVFNPVFQPTRTLLMQGKQPTTIATK